MGTDIIELYSTNNKVVEGAYDSFKKQLLSLDCTDIERSGARYYNYEVFALIGELPLNYLYVNITPSKSIFYRFGISHYEFKLEVFFDYDANDDSDVLATLHVYNKNQQDSYFGSLEYLQKVITSTYEENRENYDIFFEDTSTLPEPQVYQIV
jgi:hypothetical protein